MVISNNFQLKKEDIFKALHNSLLFFVPLVMLYLPFAISNVSTDGFIWEDLKPNMFVIGSMVLYVLNFVYDLARKFVGENKYK